MSKPVARLGDQHNCSQAQHTSTTIHSGSGNVMIAGQAAAREGDAIGCGAVIQASQACVTINGKRAARLGDESSHGGKISSGCAGITIADGDVFIELGDAGSIEIGTNVSFGA